MPKKTLIAVVAIALVTLGVGTIVYVGVARDRLSPTPVGTPVADSTPLSTRTETVRAVGVVREYSPGALIIVLEPLEGDVEQIIVLEQVRVTRADGSSATPLDIRPGQTLAAQGVLDPLGRMIADTIVIAWQPQTTPTPLATATLTPTPEPSATPTPTAMTDWEGEYFPNPDLRGAPAATRVDQVIDFRWGAEAPMAGVPADHFSIRWTSRREFEAGVYRFYARADDAVRVYVDGNVIIDAWRSGIEGLSYADVELSAGLHQLRVDYRDDVGEASVAVWWEIAGQYPDWRGEYYANPLFEGIPTLTRNDGQVDFNWGAGAPAPGLPADGFSVRWTRAFSAQEGPYRLIAAVEGDIRVWVDGLLLVDARQGTGQSEQSGHIWLAEGAHEVRVEYVNRSGPAMVRVSWEVIDYFGNWRGDYYANPDLAGQPAFVRDDEAITFDWGLDSPGPGVPPDGFSVRWSRMLHLPRGRYQFWAIADDGVRIIVDGRIVVDEWRDSPPERYTGETTLEEGMHEIIVEYYERSDKAMINFGWEVLVTPVPTLTGTPTEVVPTATLSASGTDKEHRHFTPPGLAGRVQ